MMRDLMCNIFVLLMCMAKLECLPTGQGDKVQGLLGNDVRHDMKRSVYSALPSTVSFHHITNASSIVCSEAMTFPYSRMVELSDEQMRAILQDKGGNYVRDYMASTQEEALENFPNMLILMPASTIPDSVSNFSVIDNVVAKNLVISDLQRLTAYFMSTNTTEVTSSSPLGGKWEVQNSTGNDRNNKSSEVSNSVTTTGNPSEFQLSKTTVSTLASDMTSSPTITYASERQPNVTSKMDASVTQAYVKGSTVTVPSTGRSMSTTPDDRTTLDPLVLKGIEQLYQYAHGLTKRDLDAVWREAKTTLHPSVLLELNHGQTRRKRNADGSSSNVEYCQLKGHLTEDGKFKHLCSMCAATTKLPDNIFPRYINEVVCRTGDTNCFTVGGTAHGQCKQTKFSMNMLQKKSDMCKMFIHSGETLVFEDWNLTPQTIRVSCECTINKLSVFSQYISHDVPIG